MAKNSQAVTRFAIDFTGGALDGDQMVAIDRGCVKQIGKQPPAGHDQRQTLRNFRAIAEPITPDNGSGISSLMLSRCPEAERL